MKKLNLFILSTLVAFGAFFTSCSKDSNGAVSISLDYDAFSSGAAVTGTISASAGLQNVYLISVVGTNETTTATYSTFTSGAITETATDGEYTVRISGLASGSYKLKAVDKDGAEATYSFTVGTTGSTLFSATAEHIFTGKNISCLLDSKTAGTPALASSSGTLYSISDAYNMCGDIDFIYYNKSNTYTIYSPYAYNALSETTTTASKTAVATWQTKNKTYFLDVTNTISYSTATATEVLAAATAAQTAGATSISLATSSATYSSAINKVIAFKTEYGYYGIFKVTNITQGYATGDYVQISIMTKEGVQ